MKNIYKKQLHYISLIDNNAEKLSYLTSVLRSILQVSVVTSFEIIKAQTPSDEIDLMDFTKRFCKPVDGLPLQILDNVIPFLRRYVDNEFLRGWFEQTQSIKSPLNKQLIKWVEFRNKRPAHGVLDVEVTAEWAEKTKQIIKACLNVFGHIIPILENDSSLKLSQKLGRICIETPVVRKKQAIVIISVIAKKGIWRLKGQLLSLDNAEEFTIDLPEDNIFCIKNLRPVNDYDIANIISNNKEYSFFHNIPVRQTDTFEGRTNELNTILEWMDDEDSRYCLVYGDGGYGKTTLVLELLNQFMEDQFDFNEPLPTIISYHTAKMTKWTEEGLTHFKSITPTMDECIRELMRCFYPTLPAEWYGISGRQLIDKSVGVLKENKLTRDDILLILDNTETLATTPQEVKDLGAFFKAVGKLVGRIIITSRRREFIEATPISIEGLSVHESVSLMRRLAKEYNAIPILQAGESKLRKTSNQLMKKPILLEALVKYISHSNLGIDSALENVFKKSNEELLEFLYEDAWVRMNTLQKEVFLVIIHVSCPLDQSSISQACQEIGIQHSEFHSSLMETHFAVLTDYGRNYSLELVDLAKRFFLQQFGKLQETDKNRLKHLASKVDKYAETRDRIEKEYKSDRVAEAFRSEYAKAAKVFANNNDIHSAIEMYELAIEDDPINSSLHDRFAWLLFNKTEKFEYAKRMAEKAVELDPNNCDALVDLALIHYRLEDLYSGDKYIELARKHGRPYSFCLLRKSIARYHQSKNVLDVNNAISLLEKAEKQLLIAERQNEKSDSYHAKNLKEIKKYQGLTRSKLIALRTKRTKMLNAGV